MYKPCHNNYIVHFLNVGFPCFVSLYVPLYTSLAFFNVFFFPVIFFPCVSPAFHPFLYCCALTECAVCEYGLTLEMAMIWFLVLLCCSPVGGTVASVELSRDTSGVQPQSFSSSFNHRMLKWLIPPLKKSLKMHMSED